MPLTPFQKRIVRVIWMLRSETLHRAEVGLGDDRLRLDWAADSAFRFFLVQEDEEFGYCLHRADLATNKILALAGCGEIRDFLDALQLDHEYLSFGALTWAACGKDPGYTPDLILQQTNRHSRYREDDLATEHLARPVELRDLKRQWIEARQAAGDLFDRLPAEDLGCLYLDGSGEPVTPDPCSEGFRDLSRHFGSVRGAWPRLAGL